MNAADPTQQSQEHERGQEVQEEVGEEEAGEARDANVPDGATTPVSTLRQRKPSASTIEANNQATTTTTNNSTDNAGGTTTTPSPTTTIAPAENKHKLLTKKKIMSSRRILFPHNHQLTSQQETLFLNMQLRKTNRALSGRKKRNTNYEFIALACVLVILYSIGSTNDISSGGDDDQLPEQPEQDPQFVTLTFGQVVAIGIWLFLATTITTTFRESRFIELLYWTLVYLPLLAAVMFFLFDDEALKTGDIFYNQIVWISFLVAEIMCVVIFFGIYFLYPLWIRSDWFRQSHQAARHWKIHSLAEDGWTLSYRGTKQLFWFRQKYTCKYQGEVHPETKLPHGLGQWFDDAYDGEVLVGTWKDGLPVAPFVSRHYGRGDAFRAVRIAYVMASDDEYASTHFWPSNKEPMKCGLASVECSVSGAFYNELPCASILPMKDDATTTGAGDEAFKANVFDEQTSVQELCNNLIAIGDEAEVNTVHINANDPRGVQIAGHVHAATGKSINMVPEINIKVQQETMQQMTTSHRKRRSSSIARRMQNLQYMPMSYYGGEKLIARDEDDDKTEQKEPVEESLLGTPSPPPALSVVKESKDGTTASTEEAAEKKDQQPRKQDKLQAAASVVSTTSTLPPRLSLSIDGWRPSEHKDALVYIGGFNCSLKEALENLGQFIAMSKLDARVYPILYEWPVGQVLSYHSASRVSFRQQNQENFLRLVIGILNSGIRNVHFMSHSMGVQTLLGAFCDKPDGTRSEVSKCFRLAPDYTSMNTGDEEDLLVDVDGDNDNEENLLICKTLTMLNPDYPLKPFLEHAFRSVRRICQTITIVGDRTDGALYVSQAANGIGVYFGYEQPEALLPNDHNKEHLRYLYVIGRNIDDLHFPAGYRQQSRPPSTIALDSKRSTGTTTSASAANTNNMNADYLLFSERAPLAFVPEEDEELDKAWLDVDVIDSTGLDTNIANIRHNAFTLNPSLINDLEELIRTGDRAMKRSSLLYRDGNLFSYCHAPSFVSF